MSTNTAILSSVLLCLALPAVLIADSSIDREATPNRVAQRVVNNGQVILESIPEIPRRVEERSRQYQSARSALLEDWTEDGSGIYVSTRFGQTNQLHHLAGAGAARRQLTFFSERPRSARRQPGGRWLSFLMDEGGNEQYQVFLMNPENGSLRRLTDGRARHTGPSWSPDGRHIAFARTEPKGIWMMDVEDPSSARLVSPARDSYLWIPGPWRPDGRALVIQHFVSANDARLHLLDLESGELEPLLGDASSPSFNQGWGFDAAGEGLFVVTDSRGEWRQLAYLHLATGRLELLSGEIPWSVSAVEVSSERKRLAFATNEGGISKLYLMDTGARRHRAVDDLPVGLVRTLRFSPDGHRLALALDTPQTPRDVFVLEIGEDPLTAGGLTRWTYSEVGGLDTSKMVVPELVHYPTFDRVDGAPRQIPAFVYRPPGEEGPHPVIIRIHGGPEGQYLPSFSSSTQMWIAELDTAVIAPNVRGSAGYGKEYLKLDNGMRREDSVKDIGALLDWIAEQPDLDENRVAVTGGSYGGYMVLASLVHYSDRLRAGVDTVGISNFVTFLENTSDYRRDLRRAEYGDERDPAMREFLDRISPNRHASKITSPLLVIQGANDPRVPASEAEQIVRDVRATGQEVWYVEAGNEGHGFRRKENSDLAAQVTLMFFEKHLLSL